MKLVIDWAVTVTEAGFWWLLIWSWHAAIMIAGVWLGLKISRVQSPALRHQIWLLSLIAVAVLPIWGVVVQVLPVPRAASDALINVADLPRTIAGTGAQQAAVAVSPSPRLTGAGVRAFPSTIWSLLWVAWLAGVMVVLFRMIRETRHLSRLRREAQ